MIHCFFGMVMVTCAAICMAGIGQADTLPERLWMAAGLVICLLSALGLFMSGLKPDRLRGGE